MASLPPVVRKILRFWEIPFLAALAGFMFWVRMIPYGALVGGPRAYYIGTDPFYHYREVLGITRAFPSVPRWDPWTFYPNGTGTGQFGSLFDWLVALAAILTGGPDPSELHVQRVLGIAPAVLGALLIVPFYFLAKRLLGRAGAVVASLTLAVLPGEFLIRSIAGYSDHHVAEALMALVAILAVVVAAERSHVKRDALRNLRDVRAYAGPLAWSVLAGFALAAEFLTWPPAILFLAILAAWLAFAILVEHSAGRSARGFAFAGTVAFTTAGLLMVPFVETTFLGEFNTFGILHVVTPIAAAAVLLGIHKAAKLLRMRNVSPWALPGALVGLAVAGFVGLRAVMPQTFASFAWGLSWISGVGVQRTTTTIAEARAARYFCSTDTATYSCLSNDFGMLAPVFVLTLFALAAFVVWRRRREDALLLVWGFVMFLATRTQIRFSYYVALNIALAVGWLAALVARATRLERSADEIAAAQTRADVKVTKGRRTRSVEARDAGHTWLKAGAVAAVGILVLPGNVFAIDTGARPGWDSVGIRAPDGDLTLWMDGLDWMRANTPDAGVDLSLIVDRPAPGEAFVYPDETYGVLSWWDYGHWIQTVGLRPPVANPFQQAAPFASLYFTDRDPAVAEARLDAWVQGQGPVRYVMIDDAMATGKYGAITVWANSQDPERQRYAGGDYTRTATYTVDGQSARDIPTIGPAYTESMMGRLYDRDADGLGTYRLVWEHPGYTAIGSVVRLSQGIECLHDAIPSRSCPLGIDGATVNSYRSGTLAHLGEDVYGYDLSAVSRLKIFERVEGALLVGTTDPGATVTATVPIVVDHGDGSGRRFGHTVTTAADAQGRFELRFPYSTSGMESPEEGGTNLLAQTAGLVRVVSAGRVADVDIPDRAVLDGETVAVSLA